MRLKIVTREKLILDQEVSSITLPGTEGQMTILPTHTAMVATLKKGKVLGYEIEGGFVEVLKDQVLVISKTGQTLAKDRESH